MAGPSLDTLPVELLTEISSYLCAICCGIYPYSLSQKHLSRLSRTCRRLRDVCQPLLFDYYYHSSQSTTRLLSFLRILDARPDLAKCVTNLDFLEPGQAENFDDEDRQLVESCIAKLILPPLPADWHDYVSIDRRLLIAELIIASCPNIEVLKVPMNPEWMVSVLASLLKDFVFARLKRLDVRLFYISSDHFAIDYGKISGLLHASPNLEYLCLPSIEKFYPGEAGVPSLEKLMDLDLDETAPPPYFLNCLLEACPCLQKFRLHWVYSDGYDEDSEEWSPLDGWRALQRVKSSVREIIFETNIEFPDDDNVEEGVSTLRDFARLEFLEVGGTALQALYKVWAHHSRHASMEQFVYQVFPSTITDLAIWDPDASLIEVVRLLNRETARQQYPHLARINISQSEHLSGWGFDVAQWQEAIERREFEEFKRSTIDLRIQLPTILDYPDAHYVF